MDLLLNNHQTRGLHSLRILNEIETHRELMMSVKNVLDIDSGIGLDSALPQPLQLFPHALTVYRGERSIDPPVGRLGTWPTGQNASHFFP